MRTQPDRTLVSARERVRAARHSWSDTTERLARSRERLAQSQALLKRTERPFPSGTARVVEAGPGHPVSPSGPDFAG